jgi:hypothetical protein
MAYYYQTSLKDPKEIDTNGDEPTEQAKRKSVGA